MLAESFLLGSYGFPQEQTVSFGFQPIGDLPYNHLYGIRIFLQSLRRSLSCLLIVRFIASARPTGMAHTCSFLYPSHLLSAALLWGASLWEFQHFTRFIHHQIRSMMPIDSSSTPVKSAVVTLFFVSKRVGIKPIRDSGHAMTPDACVPHWRIEPSNFRERRKSSLFSSSSFLNSSYPAGFVVFISSNSLKLNFGSLFASA